MATTTDKPIDCEQSRIFLWKVTTRKTLSRERLYNNIVVCNCAGCQDQELDGFKRKGGLQAVYYVNYSKSVGRWHSNP